MNTPNQTYQKLSNGAQNIWKLEYGEKAGVGSDQTTFKMIEVDRVKAQWC